MASIRDPNGNQGSKGFKEQEESAFDCEKLGVDFYYIHEKSLAAHRREVKWSTHETSPEYHFERKRRKALAAEAMTLQDTVDKTFAQILLQWLDRSSPTHDMCNLAVCPGEAGKS